MEEHRRLFVISLTILVSQQKKTQGNVEIALFFLLHKYGMHIIYEYGNCNIFNDTKTMSCILCDRQCYCTVLLSLLYSSSSSTSVASFMNEFHYIQYIHSSVMRGALLFSIESASKPVY